MRVVMVTAEASVAISYIPSQAQQPNTSLLNSASAQRWVQSHWQQGNVTQGKETFPPDETLGDSLAPIQP